MSVISSSFNFQVAYYNGSNNNNIYSGGVFSFSFYLHSFHIHLNKKCPEQFSLLRRRKKIVFGYFFSSVFNHMSDQNILIALIELTLYYMISCIVFHLCNCFVKKVVFLSSVLVTNNRKNTLRKKKSQEY